MKKFRITFTVDVFLGVDAIWPDGDAPENPTADDVRELIEDEGGIVRVIDDWNLAVCDYDYDVTEITVPRKP
jgi:hypothetical protein